MICISNLKNEKIVYFMLNIIKLKFSPVCRIPLTNLLQFFSRILDSYYIARDRKYYSKTILI